METKAMRGASERFTALVNGKQANQFDWGNLQMLVTGERFPGANITFGYVEIAPGRKNPKHYHPNSDEVLYLLEGELDHSVGDEVFHITAGTAVFIPKNAPHDAVNRGTQVARMVVAYDTGDRQAVMLEAGRDE